MSDLAKRLAALTPKQHELLLRKARKENEKREDGPSLQIMSQERGSAPVALSFAQERLWFLDQFEPLNTAYTIPIVVRLRGTPSLEALQNSVSLMVQRHETLRTAFTSHEGHPAQVIVPFLSLAVPLIDLRGSYREQQQEKVVERIIQQEMQRPFDLGVGPLLRVHLLWLDTREYMLVIAMHHIISDGWSVNVLLRELSLLYQATLQKAISPLQELSIQYADYALWQRNVLQGELWQRLREYWQQQLAGAPQVLNLPTDYPRGAVQSSMGATYRNIIPATLMHNLRALSQRENVTLFMTLLASFQVLLMRYSGQVDIVVGTPIANRTRRELEDLIGFFVNTLALRTDLSGNPDFRQLLARVSRVTQQAYASQDFPFEQLVEMLQPERSLSYTPIFQVLFTLQNLPTTELHLAGLTWQPIEVESTEAKFDLALTLSESPDGLHVSFVYRTDLFVADTIERFFQHWLQLIRAIVADPACPITHLPFLSSAEQQFLLRTVNQTSASGFAELRLHESIQQQVQRTPDAIAIVYQEEQLSYAALNARANQLALFLRSQASQDETPIGLFLEPSPQLLVAVLAVLKAGAMYVPLDPAYPAERLHMIIEDANISLVLTQAALLERVKQGGIICWRVDDDWSQIAHTTDKNLDIQAQADQAAYLLYTSGSTGRPKGVIVTHENVMNYVRALNERAGMATPGVSAMVQPLSADSTLTMLFPTLINGGTLLLIEREEVLDAQGLLENFSRYPVDYLKITPSHLQALLSGANMYSLLPRRRLIIGGDVLPRSWVQQFHAHLLQDARLYNHYGPTESTVGSLMYQVSAGAPVHSGVLIPIGTPLMNTQVYVLDAEWQPVPIKVIGELFIGGAGLARGYFGRPDLTAERFVPDPFAVMPGARLYRTGDLVRYLADGTLEFVGRDDGQVKIRGYRIEVGEIEATLRNHVAIREAVVVAQDTESSGKRLIAYLTLHKQQAPVTSYELQQFVRSSLPEPMVPSAFVWLDALPLIAHGKVDRATLCAMKVEEEEKPLEISSPRNETEATLARIWSQILRRTSISIYDNFFALGGDSILSIQVVAQARQAGLQLTPRQIFQAQSIAQLAILVAGSTPQIAEHEGVDGSVPLTPIQQRFFEQHLAQPHYYNQAVLLQVPGAWGATQIQQIFEVIVAQHGALRLRFHSGDSGWEQHLLDISSTNPVTVEHVDLSIFSDAEQSADLQTEINRVQASLNFEHGPLLRAALFSLGAQQPGRLLIVIHHLAVDGVSWRVILEDLQTANMQLRQGEAIQLPSQTASFPRWASYIQLLANSSSLKQDLDYWLTIVQEEILPLPVDMPGGNTVAVSQSVSKTLTTEETRLLLQEAPRPYHSQIQELLLVAVLKSLYGWTNNQKMRLELEGHGREILDDAVIDISRTVGWFTSIYPQVFRFPSTAEIGLWIKTIKEQLRTVPHKGLSYGLFRYLNEDQQVVEQLRTAQPSQVIFNYLGQFDQIADLSTERDLQLASESSGVTYSASNVRAHLLEITGQVIGGQLRLDWTYSSQLHRPETIETLAENCMHILRELLVHCLSPEAGGYTPSDFPLAHLDQETLDRIVTPQQHIEDIYPLTPLQQGLLFHTLYAPREGIYVEQLWARMQALDLQAFKHVWQQIIAQHAILRTSIIWQGLREPLQMVWEDVDSSLYTLDWSDRTEGEQQEDLHTFLQEDHARGFDLSKAPLMRLVLIRLNKTDTQLIWSRHHVIQDGWSSSMLLQEVFAGYDAYTHGQQWQLEARRPYRDYLVWLQQQDVYKAEEFWRAALTGVQSATPLGIDRPGYVTSEREYANESLWLTEEVTARLLAFTRQQGLTLNTLLQAAWAVVLSHYNGQSDVLFGTVVSGRPPELVGVERMMGVFINTLPTRIRLADEDTVGNWLKHVQEQQVELRQYEYSSLVQIHGWSEVPRDQPLFESLFVFENYPVESAFHEQHSALVVDTVQMRELTNYPLTIVAVPGEKLHLSVSYERQRFALLMMQRLLQHVRIVLMQMVDHPEPRLADLTLLTDGERTQLLVTWNSTQAMHQQKPALHQIFEQQVQYTPDALALIFLDEQLTYAALNQRANQLAHLLLEHGVGPEVVVGICLERSLELFICVLAVLKAGGAYLPLDASAPPQRLSYMLNEAHPQMILTQHSLGEQFAIQEAVVPISLLYLDELLPSLAQYSDSTPAVVFHPAHPAYVIYTSGSTGRPKGVVLPHQALLNLCTWQARMLPIDVGSRVLQFAPLSFDVSCQEMFTTWQEGGTLVVLPSEELRRDPETVLSLLALQQIERLFVPYVALQQLSLIAEMHDEYILRLQCIITAGEQLHVTPTIVSWIQRLPGCILYNHYGPSETHVVTSHLLEGDASRWPLLPPIGRPIDNTQVYVLDSDGQVVPIGVVGEMYLGGDNLARGYQERADLTAERFVPNPFSRTGGERLYRTGDLARYLPDGAIECLGRIDQQVKVRGFRVELGEIEAVLRRHPAVQESVVVMREEAPGDRRLIAYVVPASEQVERWQGLSEETYEQAEMTNTLVPQLRSFVKTELMEYAWPLHYVLLEALPLTSSGKVDRRALPAPDRSLSGSCEMFVAPHTRTQERLATIWTELLHISQISIHDNFFESGGHSLLATQLMMHIHTTFQVDVPLRSLFEAPTIAQIAMIIEQLQSELIGQAQHTELEQMLSALEELSDDELQSMLND